MGFNSGFKGLKIKVEAMKIAFFQDVMPCKEETAICNIKITMTFTE